MKLRFIVPIFVLAACGGPGTGPVSQSTAQDYCQQGCDHEHTCDPTSDVAACVSDCIANVVGVMREDVFIDATDCETALACNATSDTCLEQSCAPTSAHQAYEDKCRTTMATCDVAQAQIDSMCEVTPSGTGDTGFFCVFTPSIMDEFTACFDQACADIGTCMQGVATAHGIDV